MYVCIAHIVHMYIRIYTGPTYKLKRSEVEGMYSKDIEELYKDSSLISKKRSHFYCFKCGIVLHSS